MFESLKTAHFTQQASPSFQTLQKENKPWVSAIKKWLPNTFAFIEIKALEK